MKIRILTFHTPINYGAILQAYALQKYLKNNFPKADIQNIDFKTEKHIKKYGLFIKIRKDIFYYFSYQLGVIFKYRTLMNKKNKFSEFLKTEFSLTSRYASINDFLNSVPKATHYIVGSDQVFHPKSEYLKVFFLDFLKKDSKKIAYAPSFGMSNFNLELESKLKSYLKDFDSLSCRENDGAEFISRVTREEVPMVVDPVFLLTPNQWKKMAIEPNYNKKYIFIYDLNGGENLIKIAKQIKKYTDYVIVCQTQTPDENYNIDYQLYDLGPREFVGHMLNAEYVVTDSFHGTAFSILFKKRQFVYVARPKASGRIISLMNLIDGKNRIYDNLENLNFSKEEVLFEYDSKKVNSTIELSKKYLLNSINK